MTDSSKHEKRGEEITGGKRRRDERGEEERRKDRRSDVSRYEQAGIKAM